MARALLPGFSVVGLVCFSFLFKSVAILEAQSIRTVMTAASATAMASAPYKRITQDDRKDWNPRIDDGRIVWLKETDDPQQQAVMLYDSGGTKQIAVVQSSDITLEIENGWVFWEAWDEQDGDYEKWVYPIAGGQVIRISDPGVFDNRHHRFENGGVLWETGEEYGPKDLVFFDGTRTLTLAQSGSYRNFAFSGGAVVWESGDGGPYLRDYAILLYDGDTTQTLSQIGVANGFGGHVLADSRTPSGGFLGPYWNRGACVQGRRAAWMAWNSQDQNWEILLFDGGDVRQISDHKAYDYKPQVWGGQVAWVRQMSGADELWFYNGQEAVRITDAFHRNEDRFVLREDRLVWFREQSGPLWTYEPQLDALRMLQRSKDADGYDGFHGPVFDDRGVSWYISRYNPASTETDYLLRLYDGVQIRDLDTLQGATVGPYYQGGYLTWSNLKESRITCRQWVNWPSPGHYEEVESWIWDREVFFYAPDGGGEILQLTEDAVRHCAGVSDIDDGQVVWCGEAPSPLPTCDHCFGARCGDIFLGGLAADDLQIEAADIVLDPILRHGEETTIQATVHNRGAYPLSDVKVALWIGGVEREGAAIAAIAPGESARVDFQWMVDWTVKAALGRFTDITVKVDPLDEIYEVNEANNQAAIRISGLLKGEKRVDMTDGSGFLIADLDLVPFATPVAVWFDDDAERSDDGLPTRHYNPVATMGEVLFDIDALFNGDQLGNGFQGLEKGDFATPEAINLVDKYWLSSPGIVLAEGTTACELAGAPVAAYLNWPMLSSDLLTDGLEAVVSRLGASYLLVFAENAASANDIVAALQALNLPPERRLLVKTVVLDPPAENGPAEAFMEVLEAFGDQPSGIVVTNSRDASCFAAAPLAAFYKALILDVRDVVTGPVSYEANRYEALNGINNLISEVRDRVDDHDIKGFIQKYLQKHFKPKDMTQDQGRPYLFLVGTVNWLPFGIEREPFSPDFDPNDSDKDWIASDHRYYRAHPAIVPGGRMPLPGADNLNHMARALQFDALPAGARSESDGWETRALGAGIFNVSGKRRWQTNKVWWLDSVVYQMDELARSAPGIQILRLFEDPWRHQGGWGANWYRFDAAWAKWFKLKNQSDQIIEKAPLFWDAGNPLQNPLGTGSRGDGINNDYDLVGYEDNDGKHPVEHIFDANQNGAYDPEGDVILDEGLEPGIQATLFVELIDEEVWDGFDNDGDGMIDEDCSFWHLLPLTEVYNGQRLSAIDPILGSHDYGDLIDTELIKIEGLPSQGFVLYSGHGYNSGWAMQNVGGNQDPGDPNGSVAPNFDPPAKTSDDRTDDQTRFEHNEVPKLAPSLVIASACESSRAWEDNNISLSFLKKGALAYIGATVIAYSGSCDELVQQMLNRVENRKLHIGRAFRFAVDNLDENDLWAARYGGGNAFAYMARHGFNLFGLGSTEIYFRPHSAVPNAGGEPNNGDQTVSWSAAAPVYDSGTMTWSADITFTLPESAELTDAGGKVVEVVLPHTLMTYYADTADRPALHALPFDYDLPLGGRLVGLTLESATVRKTYDFSMYNVTDEAKRYPGEDQGETLSGDDEDPALYAGPLYPDVLFVSDSVYDSLSNNDRVYGSVAALQVDGTIPRTTVYDTVVLKITYTTPLGVQETHAVNEADLTVQATIVSTDGEIHTVIPRLTVETVGGLVHKEVVKAALTVGTAPQVVDFTVEDIQLYRYVGRIRLSENGALAAEAVFEETAPGVVLDANLEGAVRDALQKPFGPIFVSDMAGLTSLDAGGRGIVDLAGIEHCANLSELNLNLNRISDLSALANLTRLERLHLHKNAITDIAPLLSNSGLGGGDRLDLRDNPLSDLSRSTHISQLAAQGVQVQFEIRPGDLNDDTLVNLADAVAAIQVVSGIVPIQPLFTSAEIDHDGDIAISEVVFLLQAVADLR